MDGRSGPSFLCYTGAGKQPVSIQPRYLQLGVPLVHSSSHVRGSRSGGLNGGGGGGYVYRLEVAGWLRYCVIYWRSYNMERRIAEVEVDLPKHFHVVIWS